MLFFPVWKGAFYAWCAQVPQRARAFHADCASNEVKEVEIMTITVSGRKRPVTDALRQYAEEKVGNAIKAVDADTVSTEIALHREEPRQPAAGYLRGYRPRHGPHRARGGKEEDMYAAIDVAAAKVARQLRSARPACWKEGSRHRAHRRLRPRGRPPGERAGSRPSDGRAVRGRDHPPQGDGIHAHDRRRGAHPDRSAGSRLFRVH
ncbi:MAG: HPF/RaiA family ribosome-associated protein [Coriobacteriaceae bacterium]